MDTEKYPNGVTPTQSDSEKAVVAPDAPDNARVIGGGEIANLPPDPDGHLSVEERAAIVRPGFIELTCADHFRIESYSGSSI